MCTKLQQQAKCRYLNQLALKYTFERSNLLSTTEPFGCVYLSPDGVVQTYVQHLIAQKHIKVWQFLRHPACHVYICGNSSMAEEVKAEVRLVRAHEMTVIAIAACNAYVLECSITLPPRLPWCSGSYLDSSARECPF